MKIEIDTKVDSPEDIRKVVALLSHLAGKNISKIGNSNIFDNPSPSLGSSPAAETPSETPTSAFANMFGSAPSSEENEDKERDSEEEKEEIPEIMPY